MAGRRANNNARPSETPDGPGCSPTSVSSITSPSADSATYARLGGKKIKKLTERAATLQWPKYLGKVFATHFRTAKCKSVNSQLLGTLFGLPFANTILQF